MLTTRDLAGALGVSPRRVLQLAELRGVEPSHRVGSAWLWPKSAIKRLKPKRVGRPRK